MQRFLSGGRSALIKILTKQCIAQTLSPVGFPHLHGLADQQLGGGVPPVQHQRLIAAGSPLIPHHHHAIVIDNGMINTGMQFWKRAASAVVCNTNTFTGAYHLTGDLMLLPIRCRSPEAMICP